MVARIKCGKSMRGAIAYNELKVAKGDAELIHASKFGLAVAGLSTNQKLQRFNSLFKLNQRVKTNTVHISLNFDPSERFEKGELKAICQAYLDKIGFGDQPYLLYRHDDAAHPHVHILTTNIQRDGRRINLHNIGRIRSETARKAVEAEFGLVKAEGRGKEKKTELKTITHAVYGKTQTKRGIANVVTGVIRDYKFTSLNELNAVLNHYNVAVDRGHENTNMKKHHGLVYSLTKNGKRIGVPIKASSIDRQATYQFLVEHFKLNRVTRKSSQPAVVSKVKNALSSSGGSIIRFNELLRKDNITVSWAKSKTGEIFGVTFVDHANKVVFKGSDLGKDLSAVNILNKFPAEAPSARSIFRTGDVPKQELSFDPGQLQRHGVIQSLLSPIDNPSGMPLEKKRRRKRKTRKTQ